MKNKKRMIFALVSICFLTLCLFFNIASKTSPNGVKNFDAWSNDIMISDLMYAQRFGENKLFLQAVTPPMVEKFLHIDTAEGVIPRMFFENDAFSREQYVDYTSNVTAHRYFYRLISQISPFSNKANILFLYALNCVLLAIAITVVLLWIQKRTGYVTAYILMLLLAVTPSFTMYGRNLYWIAWSLFLPMCLMIFAVSRAKFQQASEKKQILVLSLLAFAGCFIKQLFYFEFITSVMIAMMIPVFCYLLEKRYTIWKMIKFSLCPAICAVFSLLAVNAIKLAMLTHEFGNAKAMELMADIYANRVAGAADNANASIAAAANSSYVRVLVNMVTKNVYALKGVFGISSAGIIAVLACFTILAVIYAKKGKHFVSRPFLISTWIGLLAPLSWFVLAKPHTYIHGVHCSFLWLLPFMLMATAVMIEFCRKSILNQINRHEDDV